MCSNSKKKPIVRKMDVFSRTHTLQLSYLALFANEAFDAGDRAVF